MRLEATQKPDEYKVWLTDSEIEDLQRATTGYRDDLIIQLGAFVGLRSFEVPQVQPRHIKTTESGQYRLRIPEGKDTTGSGGKPRDAYLPDDVERSLQQFANAENIAPREPFVDLSGRGSRAAVKRTAEATSDEIGEIDIASIGNTPA